MTTKKNTDEAATGNAEVQAVADEALAKGFVGSVPDENDRDAYTLRSGPDGVPLHTDNRTRNTQPSAPKGS